MRHCKSYAFTVISEGTDVPEGTAKSIPVQYLDLDLTAALKLDEATIRRAKFLAVPFFSIGTVRVGGKIVKGWKTQNSEKSLVHLKFIETPRYLGITKLVGNHRVKIVDQPITVYSDLSRHDRFEFD
jgi:hypothetical protein